MHMVEMPVLGREHVQGPTGRRYCSWGPRYPSQSVDKQDPSARLSPVPRGRLAQALVTIPNRRCSRRHRHVRDGQPIDIGYDRALSRSRVTELEGGGSPGPRWPRSASPLSHQESRPTVWPSLDTPTFGRELFRVA